MPNNPTTNTGQTDPTQAHTAYLDSVYDKLAGVPLDKVGEALSGSPAPAAKPVVMTLAPEGAEVGEAPTSPITVSEEAADTQSETPETVEAPQTPKTAATDKLRKSAEIQRRAREAQARARTGFDRMKARPAPAPRGNVEELAAAAVQAEKNDLAKIRAQYDNELRLAKTDPLGFARRHGVSGAQIAEYVRNGTDPNALKIEDLERRAANEINKVRQEYRAELDSIKQTFAQSQEQQVQHNFFDFVDDAKTANPEAFRALDLIYTEKEVWDKANSLLEERADLRDNFDEDKLLEAVEAEARRDPRWAKLEKLTKSATSAPQSDDKQPVRSNKSEKTETAPKAAPRQQPKPRAEDGTFKPTTPAERHANHVNSIVSRLRIGG